MKNIKFTALLLIAFLIITCTGCRAKDKSDKTSSVNNSSDQTNSLNKLPEIISLDKKMANYFDISLFDEENYSDIYLGKGFKFNVTYNDKVLTVPTTINKLEEIGFKIQPGSEYNPESYIYAKETVTLNFADENSSFSALFYNSSNSSVRLNECSIAKIRIENNHNTKNIINFNDRSIEYGRSWLFERST